MDWILVEGYRQIDKNTFFIGGVRVPIKNHFDTGVWFYIKEGTNELERCDAIFRGKKACIQEKSNQDIYGTAYSKKIKISYGESIFQIGLYYGNYDNPQLKEIFDIIVDSFNFIQ